MIVTIPILIISTVFDYYAENIKISKIKALSIYISLLYLQPCKKSIKIGTGDLMITSDQWTDTSIIVYW